MFELRPRELEGEPPAGINRRGKKGGFPQSFTRKLVRFSHAVRTLFNNTIVTWVEFKSDELLKLVAPLHQTVLSFYSFLQHMIPPSPLLQDLWAINTGMGSWDSLFPHSSIVGTWLVNWSCCCFLLDLLFFWQVYLFSCARGVSIK